MKNDFKKNAVAAFFFASFMFLQFVILRMGNQAGRGFLSAKQQENVYIFLQIFVICGIAFHIILNSIIKKEQVIKPVLPVLLGICGICSGYMLFASAGSAVYLVVTFLNVFILGFIAGRVYLYMSEYYSSGIRTGICMGTGYSAALLLQFLFQLQWFIKPVIAVFALVALMVLGYVFICGGPDEETAEEKPDFIPMRKFLSACVIAAAFLLFTAFYCGYIHHLQISSGYKDYNVYTWPRLLMIPGVLAFGLTGDYKKGRYLPLVTLCFSVTAFLNAVLVGKADTYWLNMCLYYISLSAAVSYYNLTFWKIARKTGNPAACSVSGRVIDSVTVIPLCLVSLTEASAGAVLSFNIAALVLIIIVMALNGDLNLSEQQIAPEKQKDAMSEDDILSSVADRYSLTPAEIRVFRFLVLTEDKQAAIAERLSVKLRTVQANVTSIYRKTGVTTRSGLLQIFHDIQK